jgi:two-component system, OmpR family, phosphate regulon sensor histidine kinase PhoR
MRTRFRTKAFIGSVVTAGTSLLAAALLLSWQVRERQSAALERQLVTEARLIALALEKTGAMTSLSRNAFDEEAHDFGRVVASRVTLITQDGRVVGDSTQTPAERAALDNHSTRPEVVQARQTGLGTARRYSSTVSTDMLYVAVPATHPVVRFVRVAMPLTEVDAQLSAIRRMTLVALGVGVPLALLVAWLASSPIARRVQEIARSAARYTAGDISPPKGGYGSDELGTVARILDVAAQELGRKVEDLSRDRARIDAILSGMVEGVLVIDGQGRIQRLNRAATDILDVDDRTLDQPFVTAIRHPEIVAQLSAALRGEVGSPLELPLPRDPSRTVVARASPVPAARGGGAVLVLHDISDIRRVDRMRQDFVANVSHELRTPLTAIRGYAEALADGPTDSESGPKFAEIIARHSTKMERLVTDLLRLARLDARQETLEVVPCDLVDVLNDVVADQAEAATRKRQRVTIHVAPDAHSAVADPDKLHDILRNLLENAVNYAPEEALISLSSSKVDGAVQIVVSDNGPGIPPAEVDRVFERFYRVDKSRARPGGTGLGLAIVKHLLELHGGRVTVANALAGGAVFTITLPDSA